MRILHVNKFLYRRGGAEAYMEDLAALQSSAGHTVAFFGMTHPQNTHLDLADWFPSHVEFAVGASPLERLRGAARMLWSTGAARGIAAAIDRFRPDVVHLHNVYHQLSPSVLQPIAARGIRSVMTLHDYKLACPSYQLLAHGEPCTACVDGPLTNAIRRRCKDGSLLASAMLSIETALHRRMRVYDSVETFVAPSRFLYDLMSRAGISTHRLRHIPHFVEVPFAPDPEPPGPIVLYAGRLSHEKGVDTLIDAVSLLPDVTLWIAGEGELRDRLGRQADEVASGRVEFLGRLQRDHLHSRMRRAALVAVPSRWHENQPMTILEAFAHARPVVATVLGGCRELVTPGVHGLLVEPDDPIALAGAIRTVLGDRARAAAMGAAARERAIADHDPSSHLDAVLACYESAHGHHGSRTEAPT